MAAVHKSKPGLILGECWKNLKMALISFVSSSCLYSFWLRCPLRCEDGASEAGERIRGEPIDKQNIDKLISEINIPSASDSITIALTGKASFCHKWKGIVWPGWKTGQLGFRSLFTEEWQMKKEAGGAYATQLPAFQLKTTHCSNSTYHPVAPVRCPFILFKVVRLRVPPFYLLSTISPFCPLPSFCGAAAASGFKPQGEQVPLGLMSPFGMLVSDVWVFIILLS